MFCLPNAHPEEESPQLWSSHTACACVKGTRNAFQSKILSIIPLSKDFFTIPVRQRIAYYYSLK